MKKTTAYILAAAVVAALVMGGMMPAKAGYDAGELLTRQAEVHEAAELLRELGVTESDPAIKALSDEWWRCEMMLRSEYLGEYYVTGYDPYCTHCCGKCDGITASGKVATEGYTVAASGLPFGAKVYIDGLGIFEVQDRGVGPGHIDVACNNHAECYALTGHYKVWVIDNETY